MAPVAGFSQPVEAANHPRGKITQAVWYIYSKYGTGAARAVGPIHVSTQAGSTKHTTGIITYYETEFEGVQSMRGSKPEGVTLNTRALKFFISLHFFLLFPFIGWGGSPQAAANTKTPGKVVEAASAVWKITDGRFFGTAFAIGKNRIITNAHILSDAESTEDIALLQEEGRRRLKVKRVLALSTIYDLVLFETAETMEHYLSLGEPLARGERVSLYGIGYPEGSFTYIQPKSDFVHEGPFTYAFATNQRNLEGASGGPVLNARGEVVAVSRYAFGNVGNGLKVRYLKLFLRQRGGGSIDCSHLGSRFQVCLNRGIEKMEEIVQAGKNSHAQYMYGLNPYADTGKLRVIHLKSAARKGLTLAEVKLGIHYYKKAFNAEEADRDSFDKEDYERAYAFLRPAAEKKNPVAQYYLGLILFHGTGEIEKDRFRAYSLFDEAAVFGYALAGTYKGFMMYFGDGTVKNEYEGYRWLQAGERFGDSEAENILDYIGR